MYNMELLEIKNMNMKAIKDSEELRSCYSRTEQKSQEMDKRLEEM